MCPAIITDYLKEEQRIVCCCQNPASTMAEPSYEEPTDMTANPDSLNVASGWAEDPRSGVRHVAEDL